MRRLNLNSKVADMRCLLRFEVPRFAMYSSTIRLVFLIMIGNNLTSHEL